jgi:hypothetical protein
MDDETRLRVANYQEDNPKDKYGRHVYTAAQYGLDGAALRTRFAPYIERYSVAPDKPRR